MHASIWRFKGDPAELERRYDAMLSDIPHANMRLHLCLRADDGLVVVDTCPSREVFLDFSQGPFPALCARHGLPDAERVEDFPVHAAFVDGARKPEQVTR
jgi:hypothetical protein